MIPTKNFSNKLTEEIYGDIIMYVSTRKKGKMGSDLYKCNNWFSKLLHQTIDLCS